MPCMPLKARQAKRVIVTRDKAKADLRQSWSTLACQHLGGFAGSIQWEETHQAGVLVLKLTQEMVSSKHGGQASSLHCGALPALTRTGTARTASPRTGGAPNA